MELAQNIEKVQENIEDYARKAGVPADGIRLVAVSKTVDTDLVQKAYGLGPVSYTHLDVYKRQHQVPGL